MVWRKFLNYTSSFFLLAWNFLRGMQPIVELWITVTVSCTHANNLSYVLRKFNYTRTEGKIYHTGYNNSCYEYFTSDNTIALIAAGVR